MQRPPSAHNRHGRPPTYRHPARTKPADPTARLPAGTRSSALYHHYKFAAYSPPPPAAAHHHRSGHLRRPPPPLDQLVDLEGLDSNAGSGKLNNAGFQLSLNEYQHRLDLKFGPKIHIDHLEGGDEFDTTMARKMNMCNFNSTTAAAAACSQRPLPPSHLPPLNSLHRRRCDRQPTCHRQSICLLLTPSPPPAHLSPAVNAHRRRYGHPCRSL